MPLSQGCGGRITRDSRDRKEIAEQRNNADATRQEKQIYDNDIMVVG